MIKLLLTLVALSASAPCFASYFDQYTIFDIRYEMIIFALMLVGIAVFYNKTMQVALIGLLCLCFYKYEFIEDFSVLKTLFGFTKSDGTYVQGTFNTYLNLALMLPGFSLLAHIFEQTNVPKIIPKYLKGDKSAAFLLLLCIFILSTFLDNIAAAMIGSSIAMVLYKGKVHIGYIAAICAASNAGGAGSVVGDTTTTLIWLSGKDPLILAHAFLPAIIAILFVGYFASSQQHKFATIEYDPNVKVSIDKLKLLVVFLILIGAILFNYLFEFPALGIWIAILIGRVLTKFEFQSAKNATASTVFLVSLVFCAQLVPIESIPDASILSTMVLGFVSAVFNNIPLTQLCLLKGGYDWSLISYAVGFGGSMIWFGSSAGVAVCDMFPKARSFVNWLRYGWHISIGFVIGFIAYLALIGWDPTK